MVLKECHNIRRVGVEIVIYEVVVYAVETIPPGVGLLVLCLIDAVVEGEVHNGWQIAVLLTELGVFLPCRCVGWFCHPCLAYGVEVRIFLADNLHPLCHGVAVGIRISVHTDAVDTHCLYPPDTVLDEILDDVGIALVEVGHGGYKPSVNGLVQVNLRGIWIDHWSEFIAGLQIFVVHLCRSVHGLHLHGIGLVLGGEPFGSVEPIL